MSIYKEATVNSEGTEGLIRPLIAENAQVSLESEDYTRREEVLLLPVLVAFGIINEPTVYGKLFSSDGQKWYQIWAVWTALAALVTYCARLFLTWTLARWWAG